MPIGIGGVSFEGPYSRHEILCRRPGVFAVLDGRSLPPLHAEKTDDVRQTVEEHGGWSDWQDRCDNLTFAVFYTSVDRNQRRVERAVRDAFDLYEDAGANGRPEEDGERSREPRHERVPAGERPDADATAGEQDRRSIRFHVPADPAVHRRVRVS